MWTERDQIQAYQFLRRRSVSALAAADADHPVSPSRRLVLGTLLGGVGVLLAAVGFGVSGLLSPAGAADWRQSGQVILEQGTGAHFVLGADGLLHPVINEASALLLAGADRTVTASASALSAAPRGAALGIPGAPDSLPSAGGLLAPVLVSCSGVPAGRPASAAPTSTVLVAAAGGATAALTGMAGLAPGRGLLVEPSGGPPYLIAGGYRYRLPSQAAVIALGYQSAAVLPVAPGWLDTLPAGRDLDVVAVPDAGAAGPAVGGAATRVGQVLTTGGAFGGSGGYYLVRADGLEPISQTEAALVLGDAADAAAYPGAAPALLRHSVADVGAVRQHPAADDASGYPAPIPAPTALGGAGMVCAAGDGRAAASVAVGTALPLPSGARTMPTGTAAVGTEADQVYVPPGSGALVTARVAPGAPAAALYLVTDAGMKFPVVNAAARGSLGYAAVTPAPLSPTLLALLPTGPALDPAAAQAVVTAGVAG